MVGRPPGHAEPVNGGFAAPGGRLVRAFAVLMALAVPAALPAGPAWAGAGRLEDPPDVVGLPVRDATAKLAAWNKGVFFDYVPAPDIDLGVDPPLVLVARTELLRASTARPAVRLFLGRRIPDLHGLTADAARQALEPVALRLRATPVGADPTWTVGFQAPEAGGIVEFVGGPEAVTVRMQAPVPATTAPPPSSPGPTPEDPPRLSTVELVALGGSGLALALLLVLGGLALRRTRRPASRGHEASAVERVEVRPHPGETIGPDLADMGPGVSVRLVARHGPATVTIEEERR